MTGIINHGQVIDIALLLMLHEAQQVWWEDSAGKVLYQLLVHAMNVEIKS